MDPGDTVYIRGGVYHIAADQIARRERIYACITFLDKSGKPGRYIHYWAYPGETPVFRSSLCRSAKSMAVLMNSFKEILLLAA